MVRETSAGARELSPQDAADPSPWRQLPLPFSHEPIYAAGDLFQGPSNAAALAWLERTAAWPRRQLALWGAEGSGKTHMLHVWARRTGARLLRGVALAYDAPPAEAPLAVDDADMAGERALLHLLNAAGEAGHPVLLAARAAPARWAVKLPDLASRLRAITAVEIGPADDGLLRATLARQLAERQLAVPEPVQDWLLLRLPRTAGAVREAAARLDRVALAYRRPVTRAMAALVLAGMTGPEGEPDHEDFAPNANAASTAPPRLL